MKELIKIVLKKKELSKIDEEYAIKVLKSYLTPKVKELVKEERFKNKYFKKFVRDVRAQLRRQYGAFENPKVDREELIMKKDYTGLLKSHLSSKERLKYYPKLYKDIFSITGKPKSILDVGCGMNPISYEYMRLGRVEYYALDVSFHDLKIVAEYFKQKKIKGFVKVFDAVSDDYDFNKKFDVCFCFKLFEILETTKSHRLTEDIIKKLPARWVVASFSTKTLSGGRMKRKRRIWFEVMLKRLMFEFKIVEIPNELFYIIKK